MTARQSGVRTSPETEAEVVRLVRDGQTRGQVAKAVSIHPATVSRIVRDTEGLEFARTGSSSSGTPQAMAKARGVQSEYARNRRAALSDRTLDEYERTLDQLKVTLAPRDRQLLSQSLAATGKAYSDLTALDAKAAPDLTAVVSMFDKFLAGAEAVVAIAGPARPGLIQG
ncbi:helix-turn-helix domain-containing protein [Microbacterium foliorum]